MCYTIFKENQQNQRFFHPLHDTIPLERQIERRDEHEDNGP